MTRRRLDPDAEQPRRLLVIQARPFDGLTLTQGWLTGSDGDDVSFQVCSTAGLGGALVELRMTVGDLRRTECFDIRDVVTPWVDAMAQEMRTGFDGAVLLGGDDA